MRYRPFGSTGATVSAVGLCVGERAAEQHGPELLYAALEQGINVFQVAAGDSAAIAATSEALSQVERRLIFLVLRVGSTRERSGAETRDFSPAGLVTAVRTAGAALRLGALDLVLLSDPGVDELSPKALELLRAERDAGRIKATGVSGESEAMDAYISARAFDVLATPYNLYSGWIERNRLKSAAANDMPVLGYRFFPPELDSRDRAVTQTAANESGKLNLFRRGPVQPAPAHARTAYAFLDEVKGWSGQEICLGFSLTEPGLASVMVSPRSLDEVEALAAVPDRDMPTYVAAQIEMARFSGPAARTA